MFPRGIGKPLENDEAGVEGLILLPAVSFFLTGPGGIERVQGEYRISPYQVRKSQSKAFSDNLDGVKS